MVAPRETVWSIEPHTVAKHEILKRYLHAWTAILGSSGTFKYVVYIDGFAGPGRYANGEEGSPIIALRAALEHRNRISTQLRFLFIEQDVERSKSLEEAVESIALPANFHVKVLAATSFEEGLRDVLKYYDNHQHAVCPTFAFIDPFGWTGIPLHLIQRILSFPRCEVLINFMYEEVNRFLAHPDQYGNFDDLFGTTEWRELTSLSGKTERRQAIHSLYQRQLGTAAKYVRSFEMRNKNDATDYFLFFGTNSLKGLEKMKEAMWKADKSGQFAFSDATIPGQLSLFGDGPDFESLERSLMARFLGRTISVGAIEEFVVGATPFLGSHYKRVLRAMEEQGALTIVSAPAHRRSGTFGDPNMTVTFQESKARLG